MSGLSSRVSGHSAAGGEPPSLREVSANADGGSQRAAFFSQSALLWEGSPKPLIAAHAAAGHPLFSLDEKRGEKNHIGRHLDTPSEIILQASLRMHFDGGQGSF